jgi:hypothetical protein
MNLKKKACISDVCYIPVHEFQFDFFAATTATPTTGSRFAASVKEAKHTLTRC